MKEQLYFLKIILFSFLVSCCNDDDMMMKEPDGMAVDCTEMDCSTPGDFYGVGVMNEECWIADNTELEINTPSAMMLVNLRKYESNSIDGNLSVKTKNL